MSKIRFLPARVRAAVAAAVLGLALGGGIAAAVVPAAGWAPQAGAPCCQIR